ncbi:MAG: hypothetical protein JST87_05405 [Bacteroidetes bacterium]|nr:hypothetical protein [Bacteroidota bacterium]
MKNFEEEYAKNVATRFCKDSKSYIEVFIYSEAVRFCILECYSHLIFEKRISAIEKLDPGLKQELKNEAKEFLKGIPADIKTQVQFYKALMVMNYYL